MKKTKTQKQNRKLKFEKTTVRNLRPLDNSELEAVAGGVALRTMAGCGTEA